MNIYLVKMLVIATAAAGMLCIAVAAVPVGGPQAWLTAVSAVLVATGLGFGAGAEHHHHATQRAS